MAAGWEKWFNIVFQMNIIHQSPRGSDAKTQKRQLRRELRRAALLDPGLQDLMDAIGCPEPRIRIPGFATLLRVIVSQQLSTAVAAVIWQRLERLCRAPVTHRKILNRGGDPLRQCGLSWQKVEYTLELAQRVRDKTLDLEGLGQFDAEGAIAELLKVRGIGRWSAEIYAMFALGHADIFPAGDLALQVAVQRYASLDERPDAKTTGLLAEKWSPYRTSVALLMWRYYGAATLD